MVPDIIRRQFLFLAALAVLFFSGCEILGPDDSLSVVFEADRDLYEVEIIEGIAPFLNFQIATTVRNNGDRDLALLGCQRPSMPVLQKRVDDEWMFAYGVAEPECLSPPFPLNPGDVYRDTLRVETVLRVDSPGSFLWENGIPVNGEYRLERGIYENSDNGDVWPTILPVEDRVSATFQILVVPNPISN